MIRKLVWVFGICCFVFGGLEIGCRFLPESKINSFDERLPPDPDLLWRQPRGTRINQGVEIRINSLGMRGPEIKEKEPDEMRLVSVGDSSVFGFMVEEQASYTAIACKEVDCRPMLLASPGYSTVQTLVWLDRVGRQLQADWLVIGSLWSDQSVVGFQDKSLVRDYQTFRLRWQWELLHLLNRSALFKRVRLLVKGDKNKEARDVAWQHGWNQADKGEARVPLADYAENLAALTSLSETLGAKVAFVGLAKKDEVDGVKDSRAIAYRDVLRQASVLADAPYVDAKTVWLNSGRSSSDLFADFLHPNAEGHRLVGEALAEAIKNEVSTPD